jgi:hypothetical protein
LRRHISFLISGAACLIATSNREKQFSNLLKTCSYHTTTFTASLEGRLSLLFGYTHHRRPPKIRYQAPLAQSQIAIMSMDHGGMAMSTASMAMSGMAPTGTGMSMPTSSAAGGMGAMGGMSMGGGCKISVSF